MTDITQDLGKVISKAWNSANNSIERDKLIRKEIEQFIANNDVPLVLYKTFFGKNVRCEHLLDYYVGYYKPNDFPHTHRANLSIHSSLYRFNERDSPRVATRELKQQIESIDRQIIELQDKRFNLLQENWSKCKKLGIQTAQEYNEIKKKIFDKYKEDDKK